MKVQNIVSEFILCQIKGNPNLDFENLNSFDSSAATKRQLGFEMYFLM